MWSVPPGPGTQQGIYIDVHLLGNVINFESGYIHGVHDVQIQKWKDFRINANTIDRISLEPILATDDRDQLTSIQTMFPDSTRNIRTYCKVREIGINRWDMMRGRFSKKLNYPWNKLQYDVLSNVYILKTDQMNIRTDQSISLSYLLLRFGRYVETYDKSVLKIF